MVNIFGEFVAICKMALARESGPSGDEKPELVGLCDLRFFEGP
jgi:hypothetical protein